MEFFKLDSLSYEVGNIKLFSRFSICLQPRIAVELVGANGCGKTTLLQLLAGIKYIRDGSFWLGNQRLGSPPVDKIIYLGHKSGMHPHLSVKENLGYLHKGDSSQVLEELKVKNSLCSNLSQGTLQKVKLARLKLTSASIWLLDEPLVNLDKLAISWLYSLLDEHLSNKGILAVATHMELELDNKIRVNL